MVRFGARYFNASERAVVPPAAVLPTHRSGRCRIIGASRRPGHPNRPLKARTPARPDGAILKPPAPAAGGFFFGGRGRGGQRQLRRLTFAHAKLAERGYATD